ncbi:alpha/beta fold hydrolase [Kribbella sp. NPDC000426]|uniref:alpha/beta fold hydrolase n=1 Tax=Kribbella sp. NPDC000426 TaxID=3154255 RepID=UPI00331DAA43
MWADLLKHLPTITDVYAIDLLGEPGMSVQTEPISSDEDKAAWLDQTLAALPEQRFNLLGLSIGGWTAMNLAVRRPDRIATVTTLDAVNVYDGIPLGKPVERVPVADMIEAGMKNYTLRQPQPRRITEEQLTALPMPAPARIAPGLCVA